ncbi:MAG: ribonuclease HII [Desulfurococcaceae archaeon]
MRVAHLGVDEAGRGPLVGDMVVAGVLLGDAELDALRELGLRDSKELSPRRRADLYREIVNRSLMVTAVYVAPWSLDALNVNLATARAIESILRAVGAYARARGLGAVNVYVDEVKGADVMIRSSCARALGAVLGEVLVEADADAKYLPVSAASVVAKVERDRVASALRMHYGDFGSGYPTDPRTLEWLRAFAALERPPILVRRKWATLKKIAPSWYLGRGRSLLDFVVRGRGNEPAGGGQG